MSQRIDLIAKDLILLSCFFLCQKALCQDIRAEVRDPRPVAKAIQMLESAYGISITYEDPPAVHPSQLENSEAQGTNSAAATDPSSQPRILFQKEREITFSYEPRSSLPSFNGNQQEFRSETKAAILRALSSVLKAYNGSAGPESFSVAEDADSFHVFPVSFLSESGEVKAIAPILDSKITIVPKHRSREKLLEEVCETLTNSTEVRVIVGTVPQNIMEKPTAIAGTKQSARSLLIRLMAELESSSDGEVPAQPPGNAKRAPSLGEAAGPFSWRLLYGPGFGYALNIHQVLLKPE